MQGILQTFLLAMTPIGELRVAIPVGLAVYRLNWLIVYFVAVIGNLIPVILFLLILRPLSLKLSQPTKWSGKFFAWLFNKGQKRAAKLQSKRSTYLALAAFVAVPLPITGAWTGSLIALVLGLSFRKSLLAIAAGVFAAGIIVTIVAKTGLVLERYFGWQTLFIILLSAGAMWFIVKSLRIKKLKIF